MTNLYKLREGLEFQLKAEAEEITMLCKVTESKLNMTSNLGGLITGVLYNPRENTIFNQKGPSLFHSCNHHPRRTYD